MTDSAIPVLHLVPSLEIGGMERMVTSLVLQRPQFSRVLCLEHLGPLGHELERQGVRIDCLPPARNRLQSLLELRRYLIAHRPSILHAHNLKAFTYSAAVAPTIKRLKIVLTKHGMRLPSTHGMGERLRRLAAHRSALVGVSREICQQLRAWANTRDDQVSLIENGTPRKEASASRYVLRQRLGIGEDSIVVACVARLAPEKDHATLLRAFRTLIDLRRQETMVRPIRLLLAGEGPLRNSLQTLADELALGDRVDFLGERDDIVDLFSAADVAVLASRTEGLPLTLLEAMMQRTPVVATSVGDVPSLIKDDGGCLVPPESPSLFADAMHRVISHPDQAATMTEVAYQRVLREYSIDATWNKYQSLYQKLGAL